MSTKRKQPGKPASSERPSRIILGSGSGNIGRDGPVLDWGNGFSSFRLKRSGSWTAVQQPGAGLPDVISAAEAFEEMRTNPGITCTSAIWPIILPWLENSSSELLLFWKSFDSPHAATARMNACFHNTGAARQKAEIAIKVARRIRSNDTELATHYRLLLGDYLADVLNGDPKQLDLLADSLAGKQPSPNSKGGPHSVSGLVYHAFCRFVFDHRTLPSKRMLDELSGAGCERAAARARASLGLGGLPRAKRST